MNASQMLKHLKGTFQVLEGSLVIKPKLLFRIIGPLFKANALNEAPMARFSPTAAELEVRDTPNLDAEREELIQMLRRISSTPAETFEGRRHSFFGKMTSKEWSIHMMKHMDHHLRQFGV